MPVIPPLKHWVMLYVIIGIAAVFTCEASIDYLGTELYCWVSAKP